MANEKRRLIDAKDAQKALCQYCICGDYEECENRCVEFRNIGKIPPVDAVEVIRCKDCKHWWRQNELCAHPKCRQGMVCITEALADHYCGYGERKDNERKAD